MLRAALRHAKRSGAAIVILDGTLVHLNRNQIDRPFYSGKHKRHGMNLQAIADTRGNRLWISGANPRLDPRHQGRPDLADPQAAGRA
jgi:hypothetical protein